MQQQTEPVLEREVEIEATPDVVFPFLIDPDRLVRWMGGAATLDARPGGVYEVRINDWATAQGEFVEVDPPSRVVFTFGWAGGDANGVVPGSTTVTITLEPTDRGTRLRLRQEALPSAGAAASHAHGWEHYLSRIRVAAAGGDPGPDPMASATAPTT